MDVPLACKAPILSKQIVEELVQDIEQESDILINDKRLKVYLESKYYSRFNPEVEKAVFRALWKFAFRLTDESCEKNREINYRALRLLFARNPAQFQTMVEMDKDYFSVIATTGAPVVHLVYFLSREPQLYALLADHAKAKIQHAAENDISARCLAWFTAGSLHEHATRLSEWMSDNKDTKVDQATWDALNNLSDSPEWAKQVVHLANRYYVTSGYYAVADNRFAEAIRPLLGRYTIDDCIELIEGIQDNGQTWDRKRAKGPQGDHSVLRAIAIELDPTFDPEQYPIFNRFLD